MKTTLNENIGANETQTTDMPETDTKQSATIEQNATEQNAARQREPVVPTDSQDQLRVLHVINGEHYSGAERVQDLLAQQLPQFGFDVAFACVKPDRFPQLRAAQDVPLRELSMRGRLDLRVAVRLAKQIRQENYAIVHAHTPRSALVGGIAARLAGVPFFYHVHSPTAKDSTRCVQNKVNALVERLALRSATKIITVSASLGEYMRQLGYSEKKVVVVPNGVPCTDPPSRSAPQGCWTLGTVALFRPRKGMEVLLDALASLRSEGQQVRLLAVGGFETPQYEQEIQDRAAKLGISAAIEWTGFTQDVASQLQRMDLLVLPSLFGEGLPMVVLEAMSAGVPNVATRVQGVPEAIRDGVDGVLADPGSAEDLASAIRLVLEGDLDWSALRESALIRHRERFSDKAMAEAVANVYRDVLSAQ